MYLLFKSVDDKTRRNVQVYGQWTLWTIGYIPETHVDILEYKHLNPTILDELVAKAWIFIGTYRDYITVKDNTVQIEQLNMSNSMEEDSYKQKYYLTAEDKANTTKLMQAIMRKWLDETYDKRLQALNLTASELEKDSWPEQRAEAQAYVANNTASCPLLQALATARGITLADMVQKVLDAISSYNAQVAALLAAKQVVETEIKSCNSIADCNRLLHNRYDLSMPIQQQEDELGGNQNSTLNL
jgi:hypothetical protein